MTLLAYYKAQWRGKVEKYEEKNSLQTHVRNFMYPIFPCIILHQPIITISPFFFF